MRGDVLGRGDEAAEDDGVVAVVQQPLDHGDDVLELGIRLALQVVGLAGHFQQPPAVASFVAGQLADVAAWGGVHPLGTLVFFEVQDGAATYLVGLFGRFRVGHGRPVAQRGGGRGRAGGQAAQQGQGRPPADPLVMTFLSRFKDGFAGVLQHLLEELLVLRRELVGRFLLLTLGERRVGLQVVADVGPTALDEVLGQPAAVLLVLPAGQVVGQIGKLGAQERQQRAEGLFVAAVRRGGDQDQVPVGLGGQAREKLMTLVASTASDASEGAGVGLVDDHQLGAGPQELLPPAVGLDEVDRDDDEGIDVEQRLAERAVAFQAVDRAGEDQLGVDVELVAQFRLPLLGQVRRAEHAQPGRFAAVEQFPGDQARPRWSCRYPRRRRSAAAPGRA